MIGKYLLRYLKVTGILAFIALVFPGSVVIGMFLFIVPGLILVFSPTAFLWGCAFAIPYYALRSRATPALSAIMALPLAYGLLTAIPMPSRWVAQSHFKTYNLSTIQPAARIPLRGNIRVEIDGNNKCDSLCVALLFNPGVTSVTMNPHQIFRHADVEAGGSELGLTAMTYTLRPRSGDCTGAIEPKLSGHSFGATPYDTDAIVAEWQLKLARDVCITANAPLKRYDLLLRNGYWSADREAEESKKASAGSVKRSSLWALLGRSPRAGFADIRTATGQIIFRNFDLELQTLKTPLTIDPIGGIENFNFGWGIEKFPQKRLSGSGPTDALYAALDIQRTAHSETGIATARAAISAALDSPAAISENRLSDLTRAYAGLLKPWITTDSSTANMEPEDFALFQRMIGDPRFYYSAAYPLIPKIFSEQQQKQLLPSILDAISNPPSNARFGSAGLGQVLDEFPAGTFAAPDEAMHAIIADPDKRRRANGMVSRLADMGPEAAPLLTRIVSEQLDMISATQRSSIEDDRATANAAICGLQRLGADAGGQIPALLALERHASFERLERRKWDRVLARLGKPINSFVKAKNMGSTTDQEYRKIIQPKHTQADLSAECY